MKITNINPATVNPYINKGCNQPVKAPCNSPAFKSKYSREMYVKYVENWLFWRARHDLPFTESFKKGLLTLKKLGTFTIDEYKKLTQEELNNLNEIADDYIHNNPDDLLYSENFYKKLQYYDVIATAIKDRLNHIFGENNYVVIPIGRSLSSICKCLGYKIGEDKVKQLPMSRANRFLSMDLGSPPIYYRSDKVTNLKECKNEDFDALNEYLSSIGLSKEEVKKSEKQYIFMDYCNTGYSFLAAKSLLKSNKMYGNLDNIKFINVMHLLKKAKINLIADKYYPWVHSSTEDIELMLSNSIFKKYSIVEECHRLGDTKDSLFKPDEHNLQTRIFYFKFLENVMKKQKL